jgi:GntR family transcriptional repressor for pyruvate dehydrogenase complex
MSSSKLRKLAQVRVFEQAVEQIRDLILSGTYSPGEQLPTEQELSKQLNVSRSSIREALRVLEAEGVIEVRRGAGTFVASHPFQNMIRREYVLWLSKREDSLIQLLQVRESIEGMAASLAGSLASNEDIEKLRANVEEQMSVIEETISGPEENIDKLARLDEEFHMTICAASGNDIAFEIISHIFPAFNHQYKALIYVEGRQDRMVNEHGLIFETIKAKDPGAAEKAMRKHIARVRAEITGAMIYLNEQG